MKKLIVLFQILFGFRQIAHLLWYIEMSEGASEDDFALLWGDWVAVPSNWTVERHPDIEVVTEQFAEIE